MKKTNKKRGFTIIELVIVIAVIAILAGVLIPTFSSVIEKANKSNRLQTAREALVAVLANQEDAALEGAIFEITENGTKYYYTYENGEFSTAEATGTAVPTITGLTLDKTIVFIAKSTDTVEACAHGIIESTLANKVIVHVTSTDFDQIG